MMLIININKMNKHLFFNWIMVRLLKLINLNMLSSIIMVVLLQLEMDVIYYFLKIVCKEMIILLILVVMHMNPQQIISSMIITI